MKITSACCFATSIDIRAVKLLVKQKQIVVSTRIYTKGSKLQKRKKEN